MSTHTLTQNKVPTKRILQYITNHESSAGMIPPRVFRGDDRMAALNGWIGRDLLGRQIYLMRWIAMTGPSWWFFLVNENIPLIVDHRPLSEKLDSVFPGAFESELDQSEFEAWAKLPHRMPPILVIDGGDRAGKIGRQIADLAAQPGCVAFANKDLRGPRGDVRCHTVEDLAVSSALLRDINYAMAGRMRLIIRTSCLPLELENRLRAADAVFVRLSTACVEHGRRALLPEVPLLGNLVSTAMLLGQVAGRMDDIAIVGRREVWLKQGSVWHRANVGRFRAWLCMNIAFVKQYTKKPCTIKSAQAHAILACDRFLEQIQPFKLHGQGAVENPLPAL